jgi:hypothetical protein
MTSLDTSVLKGRQPTAATSARLSAGRMLTMWQAFLGSETSVRCHTLMGRTFGIAQDLDNQYIPAGGSS